VSIPYETATAGDRAIAEMQKTLAAFGCQSFGTMVDQERQVLIVAFKWRDRQVHLEASWKGYAAALLKGKRLGYGSDRIRREQKALEQARVSVCSVLRDWVKGQTTAVECGVLTFEAAFMPHMLLKDGRRVIDAARAADLLPPPVESNVLKLEQR
jgi:hypothetical protein